MTSGVVVRKNSLYGMLIGGGLSLAAFNTSFIVLPMVLWLARSRLRIRKAHSLLLLLGFTLLLWMVFKAFWIEGFSARLKNEIFPIFTLCAFVSFYIDRSVFVGVLIGMLPVFVLDSASNIAQMFLGVDLYGGSVSQYRTDGARAQGLFGSSFFSLSISFSVFLLFYAAFGRSKVEYLFYFFMAIVGSLRAYVVIVLLFFRRFVRGSSSTWSFFAAVLTSLGIFYVTYLSISVGFFSDQSGNYFRLFAWVNAINEISMNPVFGSTASIPQMPEVLSINEDNLIYYRIYESKLLQDAVLYGIPFVIIKLVFFFEVGRQVRKSRSDEIGDMKSFLSFFLLVDFAVFSFFGMPILTVVISAILFAAPSGTNARGAASGAQMVYAGTSA